MIEHISKVIDETMQEIKQKALEQNIPEFRQFEPENKSLLKKLSKLRDLTLYPCPRMNARLTVMSCSRFQLFGREECKTCKKPSVVEQYLQKHPEALKKEK